MLPLARRGAAADLFAVPADQPDDRRGAAGADPRAEARRRHDRLSRSRQRQAGRGAGHRRQRQVPVEGRLGAPLGGARRRLRDVGQGPDRFGEAVEPDLPRCSAPSRRTASTTSSSSTRTARRSRSRRATASPSTSGWPTPRRRACRCSCSRSRGRRSGSISTSSRRRSTSTSRSSTPIPASPRTSTSATRSGTSIPARRRRSTCRSPSRCSSTSPARRTRTTRACCGASSSATCQGVTPESHPKLDELVGYAVRYYDDFVAPKKVFRHPDAVEREALAALDRGARASLTQGARPTPRRSRTRSTRSAASFERFQDEEQGRARRPAGRGAHLVRDALPGAARHGARPALRLLRRDLRHPGDARPDPEGAGGRAGGVMFVV